MIYICEKCKFLFQRVALPDNCPDCGSQSIREANAEEQNEFKKHQDEFNNQKYF